MNVVHSEACMVGAVVLLFVLYPLFGANYSIPDLDVWWHMRTGEWILRHHALPRTDPFSITGAGKPWVAYSWLFEVMAYWIGKYWDLIGLEAMRLAIWLASTWAFYRLLRKATPGFWRAFGLTLLGSFVMVRAFPGRPGALTVLFFIIELGIVWEADRSGQSRKLWLLPPLLCLWANIHAQFVYGLFLLGLFCIEPVLDLVFHPQGAVAAGSKIPNLRWWIIGAASFTATFVNPYGWGVYKVILTYGHQVWSTRYIVELEPLRFNRPSEIAAVLLALGAAFAIGRAQRIRSAWVVLLVWAVISAFRAQRDIWVLAVVCCFLVATSGGTREEQGTPLSRPAQLASFAVVLTILLFLWPKFTPTSKQLLNFQSRQLPLGAVAYIHEHHLRGPLFNNFDWGGFLIYALPEEKVAIDGRTNVHGSAEMQRSMSTWAGAPGWQSDPLLQNAHLVIASPNFALTQLLRHDAQFKTLFDDGVSVVFERVAPAQHD